MAAEPTEADWLEGRDPQTERDRMSESREERLAEVLGAHEPTWANAGFVCKACGHVFVRGNPGSYSGFADPDGIKALIRSHVAAALVAADPVPDAETDERTLLERLNAILDACDVTDAHSDLWERVRRATTGDPADPAPEVARKRIARAEALIDAWEHDAPGVVEPVFIGRLRETLRRDPAPVRLRADRILRNAEGADDE